MLGHALLTAATLAGSVTAGTVLWDGRFNEFNSSVDLNNWSWANQVCHTPQNPKPFRYRHFPPTTKPPFSENAIH